MGVEYRYLRMILADRKLEWVDIRKQTGISTRTMGKLKNDEYVDLATLEKIARYLKCEIGDIVSLQKD